MGSRARAAGALSNLIWTLWKEDHLKHAIQQSLPFLRRAFSLYCYNSSFFAGEGTKNAVNYEGSLLCVGNILMSWAAIEIFNITPDRKKTPEPQQSEQSTDGAVNNESSNFRVTANGNM